MATKDGSDDELEFKLNLIRKQTCFAQFSEKELSELADLWVEQNAAKGDVIVEEGGIVDSVYLIIKGTAEVRHDRIVQNKLHSEVMAKLGPGDAIGLNETGFYSLSGRRTATVAAQTDMVLYRLNVAAFNGFSLFHPHVNSVMRQQAKKFLNFGKSFENH